jgi:hypothetical protein
MTIRPPYARTAVETDATRRRAARREDAGWPVSGHCSTVYGGRALALGKTFGAWFVLVI